MTGAGAPGRPALQRVVSDDPAGVAAERIATVVRAGGHVALSGGSTPRATYERLAAIEGLDWSAATLWFGDDRCVPPDDARSNLRLVREALLDRLSGPPPAVERIRGELDPEAAADDYAARLRAAFGPGMPPLDLQLMGLGPDCHTGSLFPGKPALAERERTVVAVPEAGVEPFVPRVTMTVPAFNAARAVLFLVTGADKAEPVARAFDHPPGPDRPASLIAPPGGTLTLLLDPAAATPRSREDM